MTPLSKLSSLKIEMAPFVTFWPRNGSHRIPKLSVTRFEARQESWAYSPDVRVVHGQRRLRPPCSTVVIRPSSKSASPSPVPEPLKLPRRRWLATRTYSRPPSTARFRRTPN